MNIHIDEKKIVVDILSQSFLENRSVNFVVKQDKKRVDRIKTLMSYSYFMGKKNGKVYLSDDQKSCAIVLFPKSKKPDIASVLWDLKLVLKSIGLSGVSKVLKRESEIKKNHPDFPFIHLWYIGVSPHEQGKGLGRVLMNQIIRDSIQMNLPIYLETSTPRNFKFYEDLGFRLLNTIDDLGYSMKLYIKEV